MPDNTPQEDEVEVVFFGPGYGESIVIHAGYNQWIIVDSCIEKNSLQPAPLVYLESIGVDPSIDVKLVIATHWHDDHVRGLSKILSACASAKFVCSEALKSDDFLELINIYGGPTEDSNSKGTSEFYRIFHELKERLEPPKLASADKTLWNNSYIKSASFDCSIHALSPSDLENFKAKLSLSNFLPEDKLPMKKLVAPTPNGASVVLWCQFGDTYMLLGADMEETGNDKTGWSVIIDSSTKPSGKASIYKVAHHGSVTGHLPAIWDKMLEATPLAVLTPFRNGGVSLPTSDDVCRICEKTKKAYATSTGRSTKKRNPQSNYVRKIIKRSTRKFREASYSSGYVKISGFPATDPTNWTEELVGDACLLQDFQKAS